MEKISKEMKAIINAIDKWNTKHKNNTSFVGSFIAFDKNSNVIDDRIFTYGYKDSLKIALDALTEEVKKEKEEFVNW